MPEITLAPVIDPAKEVRLAVVLYGGVSLAIYINGVAQELLHLVRATAADPASPDGTRRARFKDYDEGMPARPRISRKSSRYTGISRKNAFRLVLRLAMLPSRRGIQLT